MSKTIKNTAIICSCLFLLIQVVILYRYNFLLYENNITAQKNTNEEVPLDYIYKKLSVIKNKEILNAVKVNDKWMVEILIKDENNNLYDEINKLKEYNINEYNINSKDNEKYVTLKIIF